MHPKSRLSKDFWVTPPPNLKSQFTPPPPPRKILGAGHRTARGGGKFSKFWKLGGG
ncbi:MAG: hypothetical protein GY820_21575 [Gammaproteobacteria bacterium]|nr:hypothetical protein [Gammaproteobacteria bacterium]